MPRGEPPRDAWGIFSAILLYVLYVALFHSAGRLVGPVSRSLLPYERLLAVDAVAKAVVLGAVVLLVRFAGHSPGGVGAPRAAAARAGVLTGLAFLPVMVGAMFLQQWAYERMGWRMEAQDLVTKAVEGDPVLFAEVALFAVTVAPAFEEVLFRGYLYAGCRARLGPAVSAAVTAALFALIHETPDVYPVTFLLGLVLADLRERTGGLTAPIAAHACYNAFQMAGVWLARPGGG